MKSISIGMMIMIAFCASLAHANGLSSLTLSDSEMQKLKKYFPAEEDKNLVWKGDPLIVSLSKNNEKRIVFPSAVLVDVKGALTTDQLRIVNNDKSLYLTALSVFPKTRIYVTLQDTGDVVLVDLVVNDHADIATQYVTTIKGHNDIKQNISFQNNQTSSSNDDEDLSTVDLMRFAFQQLYAPAQIQESFTVYNRVSMHAEQFVPDLVYGDKVISHPVGSWIAGNRYVTAIALQNKYPYTTHIDIRNDLCGNWQAAVIYPRTTLLFHGEQFHDSTMLFLVSQKPFNEAMAVCHGNS